MSQLQLSPIEAVKDDGGVITTTTNEQVRLRTNAKKKKMTNKRRGRDDEEEEHILPFDSRHCHSSVPFTMGSNLARKTKQQQQQHDVYASHDSVSQRMTVVRSGGGGGSTGGSRSASCPPPPPPLAGADSDISTTRSNVDSFSHLEGSLRDAVQRAFTSKKKKMVPKGGGGQQSKDGSQHHHHLGEAQQQQQQSSFLPRIEDLRRQRILASKNTSGANRYGDEKKEGPPPLLHATSGGSATPLENNNKKNKLSSSSPLPPVILDTWREKRGLSQKDAFEAVARHISHFSAQDEQVEVTRDVCSRWMQGAINAMQGQDTLVTTELVSASLMSLDQLLALLLRWEPSLQNVVTVVRGAIHRGIMPSGHLEESSSLMKKTDRYGEEEEEEADENHDVVDKLGWIRLDPSVCLLESRDNLLKEETLRDPYRSRDTFFAACSKLLTKRAKMEQRLGNMHHTLELGKQSTLLLQKQQRKGALQKALGAWRMQTKHDKQFDKLKSKMVEVSAQMEIVKKENGKLIVQLNNLKRATDSRISLLEMERRTLSKNVESKDETLERFRSDYNAMQQRMLEHQYANGGGGSNILLQRNDSLGDMMMNNSNDTTEGRNNQNQQQNFGQALLLEAQKSGMERWKRAFQDVISRPVAPGDNPFENFNRQRNEQCIRLMGNVLSASTASLSDCEARLFQWCNTMLEPIIPLFLSDPPQQHGKNASSNVVVVGSGKQHTKQKTSSVEETAQRRRLLTFGGAARGGGGGGGLEAAIEGDGSADNNTMPLCGLLALLHVISPGHVPSASVRSCLGNNSNHVDDDDSILQYYTSELNLCTGGIPVGILHKRPRHEQVMFLCHIFIRVCGHASPPTTSSADGWVSHQPLKPPVADEDKTFWEEELGFNHSQQKQLYSRCDVNSSTDDDDGCTQEMVAGGGATQLKRISQFNSFQSIGSQVWDAVSASVLHFLSDTMDTMVTDGNEGPTVTVDQLEPFYNVLRYRDDVCKHVDATLEELEIVQKKVLLPTAARLRRVFFFYASGGNKVDRNLGMCKEEFISMCCDARLTAATTGGQKQQQQQQLFKQAQLDSVFEEVADGHGKNAELKPENLKFVIVALASLLDDAKADQETAAISSPSTTPQTNNLQTVVNATDTATLLLPSIALKVKRIVEEHFLRFCNGASMERFHQVLKSQPVKEVFQLHRSMLKRLFRHYSGFEVGGDRGDISIKEFLRFCADGKIPDEVCTHSALEHIYWKIPEGHLANPEVNKNATTTTTTASSASPPSIPSSLNTAAQQQKLNAMIGIGLKDFEAVLLALSTYKFPSPFIAPHQKLQRFVESYLTHMQAAKKK